MIIIRSRTKDGNGMSFRSKSPAVRTVMMLWSKAQDVGE
jgi:hypothetical protein